MGIKNGKSNTKQVLRRFLSEPKKKLEFLGLILAIAFLIPLVQASGTVNDSGGNWTIFDSSGGGTVNDSSGNWSVLVTVGGGTVNDSGGANWTIYAYFAEEPASAPPATGGGTSPATPIAEPTPTPTPTPVTTNPVINWLNTPVIDFTIPPPPTPPKPLAIGGSEVDLTSPIAALLPTSGHIQIKVWHIIVLTSIIAGLGIGLWLLWGKKIV